MLLRNQLRLQAPTIGNLLAERFLFGIRIHQHLLRRHPWAESARTLDNCKSGDNTDVFRFELKCDTGRVMLDSGRIGSASVLSWHNLFLPS
jgi:hypothetical protein